MMMAQAVHALHVLENRVGGFASRLGRSHPNVALWAAFVGLPVITIAAVAAFAAGVMLPVAWLCGWL